MDHRDSECEESSLQYIFVPYMAGRVLADKTHEGNCRAHSELTFRSQRLNEPILSP